MIRHSNNWTTFFFSLSHVYSAIFCFFNCFQMESSDRQMWQTPPAWITSRSASTFQPQHSNNKASQCNGWDVKDVMLPDSTNRCEIALLAQDMPLLWKKAIPCEMKVNASYICVSSTFQKSLDSSFTLENSVHFVQKKLSTENSYGQLSGPYETCNDTVEGFWIFLGGQCLHFVQTLDPRGPGYLYLTGSIVSCR